ncbi:hypothetical protein K4749_01175 [Streptomyces sp. TRM72054]|uniref:hypothetical protein n=1 Tax=Streptomyces sp. TRM72054 TaxID=2870562 RepID=UPI001C8BCC5C|nr:hypothetical protein [Streptomyces sp. TRM72054]MBX9392242.1 hypothetical protein [Streptomyces sp. TRM72054]
MTDRHTVDTITSDQLDALYDQLEDDAAQHDRAMKTVSRERETYRAAWKEAQRMRAKAEQRAEQAEELLRIAHGTSNRAEAERARAVQRAERAETALVRVHHVAALIHAGAPWTANHHETAARIRAALAEPSSLAETEATEPALLAGIRDLSIPEPPKAPVCGCTYGERCPNCRD